MLKGAMSVGCGVAALALLAGGCAGAGTGLNNGKGAGGDNTAPADADNTPAAVDDTQTRQGSDAAQPDDEGEAPAVDTSRRRADTAETVTPDKTPEAYLGGWLKADCADATQGTGSKPGQVAPDFEQPDQFGELLRLHDFCDRAVLLVGSAFWWAGCREEAPSLEPLYQKYKDQGFIIITLLTENYEQVPPSQADLKAWADKYGESFPVISDGDRYIHTFGSKKTGKGGKTEVKLPSFTLLGPGAKVIIAAKEFTEDDIIAALP